MKKDVEIEVSARHIHLSKEDYSLLFGAETAFNNIHELSQKNQFATDKVVRIIGPNNDLPARFLSPFRDRTQVELSLTDCFDIGISAPYKISVDDDATEIKISGSEGEITRRAAIITKRHLHIDQQSATAFGIKDGSNIALDIKTDRGKLSYDDIEVKVRSDFQLRVHLDTDEGNAAGIKQKTIGELIIAENDISN